MWAAPTVVQRYFYCCSPLAAHIVAPSEAGNGERYAHSMAGLDVQFAVWASPGVPANAGAVLLAKYLFCPDPCIELPGTTMPVAACLPNRWGAVCVWVGKLLRPIGDGRFCDEIVSNAAVVPKWVANHFGAHG